MTDLSWPSLHGLWWPLLAGVLLGVGYLGLLWLTVRRLAVTPRPGALLLLSTVARLAAVAAALVWVADGRFDRLLACLGGFFAARTLMISRVRAGSTPSGSGQHLVSAMPGPGKGGDAGATDA
jgi:F1F0 ATPase subunit 2